MTYETFNYTPDGRVNLKTYIPDIYAPDAPLRPAMIACPGGAWSWLAPYEGEQVALTFVKEGFAGFVLNYSIGDYSEYPNPLVELCWAIMTVRKNAAKWHIDPDKIAVTGFSAGSTIAAMAATQWMDPVIEKTLGEPKEMYRPNAAVLCYGCNDLSNIFDEDNDAAASMKLGKLATDRTPQTSIAKYVTKDTAPMFFFHTSTDEIVPVKNTWLVAEKLDEVGIPFEMHIFGRGPHGMSVNNRMTARKEDIDAGVTQWVPLCVMWLDKVFGI